MKFIQVSVGVLINSSQQVLLASRPEGKPYAGWWEFPGGKQELGESAWQALSRELEEELGIRVSQGQFWLRRTHHYDQLTVELTFFLIRDWRGELQSREGQRLVWLPIDSSASCLDQFDGGGILPATEPLIRWLSLPSRIDLNGVAPDYQGVVILDELGRLSKGSNSQAVRGAQAVSQGAPFVGLMQSLDASGRDMEIQGALDFVLVSPSTEQL